MVRFILLLCVMAVIFSGTSWANALLYVAPSRVVIKGDSRTEVVSVTNKSDQVRRYKIKFIDQVMGANGVTQPQETFDYSSKRMVRFMPREITLKPGERQLVRLMVRRPKDLADGDYHTHMLFEEEQLTAEELASEDLGGNAVKFEVGAIYSVAVPVVVQKGKVFYEVSLLGAEVVKDEKGKSFLQAHVARQGNSEGYGALYTKFIGEDGTEKKLSSPQSIRLYREVDEVRLAVRITEVQDLDSLGKGKIVLTLRAGMGEEKPVLGEVAVFVE
ncbi:MAG: hypothetical protein OXR68_07450 [Alphaproteobacteria bacterium]|nr:hypothetical protein [Alphaproteobacteria bacterium]MDD9920438.1 hypothetical protein [Alphaproteobacteria bacterium]